jgi:hypothetical protein
VVDVVSFGAKRGTTEMSKIICKNTAIAFLCGAVLAFTISVISFSIAGITVTTTTTTNQDTHGYELYPQDNPSGLSRTSIDDHGMKYTELLFGEIARSVDKETLTNHKVEYFYDDARTVPDWGYYANCNLDEKEKLEYTTFRDNGETNVQLITNYHYAQDNGLIENQVLAYIRILREAGYELDMTAPWGVNYSKDGVYIQLSQNNDTLSHRICISITNYSLGL